MDLINWSFTLISFLFSKLVEFGTAIFAAISPNTVPLILGAFLLYTIARVLLGPFVGGIGERGSDNVRRMKESRAFMNKVADSAQVSNSNERNESRGD